MPNSKACQRDELGIPSRGSAPPGHKGSRTRGADARALFKVSEGPPPPYRSKPPNHPGNSSRTSNERLGRPASHGCVRISPGHAAEPLGKRKQNRNRRRCNKTRLTQYRATDELSPMSVDVCLSEASTAQARTFA